MSVVQGEGKITVQLSVVGEERPNVRTRLTLNFVLTYDVSMR